VTVEKNDAVAVYFIMINADDCCYHPQSGVVIDSAASVCLSVLCNTITFESLCLFSTLT